MKHLYLVHHHLHDRCMNVSASRSAAPMERLTHLNCRTKEQRDQSVAQRVVEIAVEEEEGRLVGMIWNESHRRRLEQRSKNLL